MSRKKVISLSDMKEIIRKCFENNEDLKVHVREFIKTLPKVDDTGIYKGV